MCDKVDLELRVYITGYRGGHIDWLVLAIEADGQSCWEDDGSSTWLPGRPVTPRELLPTISRSIRRLSRLAREA